MFLTTVVTSSYIHGAIFQYINPLNAELKPICLLLALLGGATIVDVSRLRVKRVPSRQSEDNNSVKILTDHFQHLHTIN
jgi:hypothetical protein